jgi:hypothetical protein
MLSPAVCPDVYGIPFSVIPFKGRPTNQLTPEDQPKNRVWALPDREHMEIRFPIVEGYVFQTTKGLKLKKKLEKALGRYRDRWDPQDLSELAQQLRKFADSPEQEPATKRKKE